MARNGAGTYSLPALNPVVTSTVISSTWANNTMSDIATALTNSIASDGQTPITANIPMASHKLTGLASASTAGDALAYGQASWSLAAGTLTGALAMSGAAINTAQGTDVASAGTIDLDAATGNVVDVTGTTTITAITLSQGRTRVVRFTGILTLTNGASLVLPSGANITTAAGDYAIFAGYASSVVRCVYYSRASGQSLVTSVTQLQTVSGTVAASALTAGYAGGNLDFRSATIGSGTVTTLTVGALSLVVSSGSTLGTSNGLPARLWLAVINNAGTGELAICNTQLGSGQIFPVNESQLISTTAEGGAGAADSAGVWYSTTARSNVAFRLVGYLECTEATAGTWATAPAVIEGMGLGVRKPGDRIQEQYSVSGAVATGSTVLPFDDTIPQSGEGNQFYSKAITPTSAINVLRVKSILNFGTSSSDSTMAIALFQDATANALATSSCPPTGSNILVQGSLFYDFTAGTTSATTLKINLGQAGAATITINGTGGARKYGGVLNSGLWIEEVMA